MATKSKKKSTVKNSNVIPDGHFQVGIYDGLSYICGSSKYTDKGEAYSAAKRIIEHQKKLDPSMTAYAMVFDKKRMLFYID